MRELVSVIVPVYNVEEYLRECIDSIVCQTYQNLEILLVDDGATDNCGEICDEYAKNDTRVKALHKKNGGLSDARNYGMEYMQGELVCFIDADDAIDKNYIEVLYNTLCENDADIAGCRFYRDAPTGEKIYPKPDTAFNFCISNIEYMKKFYNNFGVFAPAWGKLYKRNILEDIKYPKVKKAEDASILREIIFKCTKTAWTEAPLYFYRNRENSISNVFTYENALDGINWIENDLKFYSENNIKELIPYAAKAYCFTIISLWPFIPEDKRGGFRKKYCSRLRCMLFKKGNSIKSKLKYLYKTMYILHSKAVY